MGETNISIILHYFMIIIIMVITTIVVGKINYENGMIAQCRELGLLRTSGKQCVPCEDTGRMWVDGECKYYENIYEMPENIKGINISEIQNG